MDGWFDLEPDREQFKAYLRCELVKRFASEDFEEEIRSMKHEELYNVVKGISAQFLRKKR